MSAMASATSTPGRPKGERQCGFVDFDQLFHSLMAMRGAIYNYWKVNIRLFRIRGYENVSSGLLTMNKNH